MGGTFSWLLGANFQSNVFLTNEFFLEFGQMHNILELETTRAWRGAGHAAENNKEKDHLKTNDLQCEGILQ